MEHKRTIEIKPSGKHSTVQWKPTAQLQIKDISPEFLQALKVAAAQSGKTLKDFVVDSLCRQLLFPPVVVGGTKPGAEIVTRTAPGPNKYISSKGFRRGKQ